VLPAAAPVEKPPRSPALYALAGVSLFVHAAVGLVLVAGVLLGALLIGVLIAIVTLGLVHDPLREALDMLQHADAMFTAMTLFLALKPIAIILTILALRSVRWAQLALSGAVGLLAAADFVGAMVCLFKTEPVVPGALLLIVVAAGQGLLLWTLEGKRGS
jgi:hypothetical protein